MLRLDNTRLLVFTEILQYSVDIMMKAHFRLFLVTSNISSMFMAFPLIEYSTHTRVGQ